MTERRTNDAREGAGGPATLDALHQPFDEHRVRQTFRALAAVLARLHGKGRTVGSLTPEAVVLRPDGVELRPGEGDPSWTAPEGRGDAAADWYVFGLLLYRVLTRGAAFDGHGRSNGPDPRDHFADAPDDLSALAMDLLLLDADERCGPEEVFDVLTSDEPVEPPVRDWLDEALVRGGLVVRSEGVARDLERLGGERVAHLTGDPEAVASLVRTADALTSVDRALATTLITAPEALESGAFQRAAILLARALVVAGVRVAWLRLDRLPSMAMVFALTRADPAPLWVIEGTLAAADRVRLAAEGVPGVDGPGLDALPFAAGPSDRAIDELQLLGVTAAPAPWGRAIARWERWRTPSRLGVPGSDTSVDRAIFTHGLTLFWSDLERMSAASAQLRRRAVASGDVDGVWSAALMDAAAGGEEPPQPPRSDRGRAWQRLGRAIRHAASGRLARVEQLLDGDVPLQAGVEEDAVAVVFLAEALVLRGRWRRAARVLRQLRVDARLQGRPAWEAAAVAVEARMIGGAATPDEPTGWVGLLQLRAAVDTALRLGRLEEARTLARRLAAAHRSWPLRDGGGGARVRMLVHSLDAMVAGPAAEVVGGHPATPAWKEIERAAAARRAGDLTLVEEALREASHRFDGCNRTLEALVVRRIQGLFLGGVRGGTLVEQSDQALMREGVHGIPRLSRSLFPALVLDG